MENQYGIQAASKITGLSAHLLRAWEKRYQAVVPGRDQFGRRLYSESDIEKLCLLEDLVKNGHTISQIASKETDALEQLKNNHSKLQKDNFHQTNSSQVNINYNEVLQNFILALKLFKLDVISHELTKLKGSIGPKDFALNILSPLLGIVGGMCDKGELTIAQEHALSALIKFHVGEYLFSYKKQVANDEHNIILATTSLEKHEFGIMISALLCAHYKIKFYYLSTEMPVDAIKEAAHQINSKLIILGYSRYSESQNLFQINDELKELSSLEGVNIWAGGISKLDKSIPTDNIQAISTLQMLDYELAKLIK